MNDNRKKYELFAQMDPVKFMDFMIDFLDNLGMNIKYYELDLPTDKKFAQVYGNFMLKYHVVKDEYTIILDTIEPTDFLFNGLTSELTTYKGVMISKENATRDMFKIDLLSMLDKK